MEWQQRWEGNRRACHHLPPPSPRLCVCACGNNEGKKGRGKGREQKEEVVFCCCCCCCCRTQERSSSRKCHSDPPESRNNFVLIIGGTAFLPPPPLFFCPSFVSTMSPISSIPINLIPSILHIIHRLAGRFVVPLPVSHSIMPQFLGICFYFLLFPSSLSCS